MTSSALMYRWEKVLYGGLILLVVIDIVILTLNWSNPVLRATGFLSVVAGILVFLGHFFDWKVKEWLITVYIIPLVLLGVGGIHNYYSVINSLLALGGESQVRSPVPPADYGAELFQHYISLMGGPLVRLAAFFCRKYCK